MKFFKNNKWTWILVGVIILIPIVLNWLILLPKLFPIVGNDKIWLSFWGSYIGSIISSLIAVFILYKQLEQNHSENEANRNLQLNNINYQQQIDWLADMRKACIANIYSYDTNDIIETLNSMQVNNYQAFLQIKKFKSNLAKTDTEVAFLGNNDIPFRKKFDSKRMEYFKEYESLIDDIKRVVASLINAKDKSFESYRLYIINNPETSKDFVDFINKYKIKNELSDVVNLSRAAAEYLDQKPNYFENIRKITSDYLTQENKRINEICQKLELA